MPYGYYDSQRRYRRRFWLRLLNVVLVIGGVGAIAGFTYQLGVEQMKSRVASLEAEASGLMTAKERADKLATQAQQRAQAAEVRVGELELRYQRDVPSGELAKLRDMIARRLAEGVDANRLAFVIEQTGSQRACGTTETKRFVLPTPLYKGANTSVAFADGAVVVTGEGTPFRNAEGQPEAWFDTTKPITLRFMKLGGEPIVATGRLPMQHSVVVNDKEFRFTISAGSRSFVEVAGTACPFP